MSEATPLVGGESTRLDPKIAEFAVPAGSNKFHSEKCPTCGFEGYVNPTTPDGKHTWEGNWFLFRDHLSAKEYKISAMCQECQNSVFDVDDPSEPEPEESYGEFYSSVDEDDYLASRQEDMDR